MLLRCQRDDWTYFGRGRGRGKGKGKRVAMLMLMLMLMLGWKPAHVISWCCGSPLGRGIRQRPLLGCQRPSTDAGQLTKVRYPRRYWPWNSFFFSFTSLITLAVCLGRGCDWSPELCLFNHCLTALTLKRGSEGSNKQHWLSWPRLSSQDEITSFLRWNKPACVRLCVYFFLPVKKW